MLKESIIPNLFLSIFQIHCGALFVFFYVCYFCDHKTMKSSWRARIMADGTHD